MGFNDAKTRGMAQGRIFVASTGQRSKQMASWSPSNGFYVQRHRRGGRARDRLGSLRAPKLIPSGLYGHSWETPTISRGVVSPALPAAADRQSDQQAPSHSDETGVWGTSLPVASLLSPEGRYRLHSRVTATLANTYLTL